MKLHQHSGSSNAICYLLASLFSAISVSVLRSRAAEAKTCTGPCRSPSALRPARRPGPPGFASAHRRRRSGATGGRPSAASGPGPSSSAATPAAGRLSVADALVALSTGRAPAAIAARRLSPPAALVALSTGRQPAAPAAHGGSLPSGTRDAAGLVVARGRKRGQKASRQSGPKQTPIDTNMTVGGTEEKQLADRAARSRHQSILI